MCQRSLPSNQCVCSQVSSRYLPAHSSTIETEHASVVPKTVNTCAQLSRKGLRFVLESQEKLFLVVVSHLSDQMTAPAHPKYSQTDRRDGPLPNHHPITLIGRHSILSRHHFNCQLRCRSYCPMSEIQAYLLRI